MVSRKKGVRNEQCRPEVTHTNELPRIMPDDLPDIPHNERNEAASAGEQWLTVAQAAAALGLATPTVYLQIARGRIPSSRVGHQHRISPAALAHYSRTYLGLSGWDRRRADDYTPAKTADYSRRSRARRRALGADLTPTDVETLVAGRPDGATIATLLQVVRGHADWTVRETRLPGKIVAVELQHRPSGRAHTLRRRRGRSLWKLQNDETW